MGDNFEEIIRANYQGNDQMPEGFDPWAFHMANALHFLQDPEHTKDPLAIAAAQAHALMAMSWATRKQIDVLDDIHGHLHDED